MGLICNICNLEKSPEDFYTLYKYVKKNGEESIYKNLVCKKCIPLIRRERYYNDEVYRTKRLLENKLCKEKKREEYLKKRREWRARNRDKINKKLRDFHAQHKKEKSEYYLRKLKYSKEYAKSHRREKNVWQQDYHEKLRRELVQKLGGKCIRCEEKDVDVLEFDHIEPILQRERSFYGVKLHPELYQLLCANCHCKKTREDMKVILCQKQ